MKGKLILIHSEHDQHSRELKQYLDSNGIEYCLLNWYTPGSSRDPERAYLNFERLLSMHMNVLTGEVYDNLVWHPTVGYSDQDFDTQNHDEEWDRWNMSCCDEHRGKGYSGPPIRATGSIVHELDGKLTLWDTPASLEDCVPEKVAFSVEAGQCLAGQWLDSAVATSESPWWSNLILRRSVQKYKQTYFPVLDLRQTVLVEAMHVSK